MFCVCVEREPNHCNDKCVEREAGRLRVLVFALDISHLGSFGPITALVLERQLQATAKNLA